MGKPVVQLAGVQAIRVRGEPGAKFVPSCFVMCVPVHHAVVGTETVLRVLHARNFIVLKTGLCDVVRVFSTETLVAHDHAQSVRRTKMFKLSSFVVKVVLLRAMD